MKRRNYIKSVGGIALTPIAVRGASGASTTDENPILEHPARIRRYDVGTVVTLPVPRAIDPLSISVRVGTNDDSLDHWYIDSVSNPIEEIDDLQVFHYFHQQDNAEHEIELTQRGAPNIEVETVEQNILGDPWIEDLEEYRQIGETDYVTIRKLSGSGIRIGYELDTEYESLVFTTYDKEQDEWVEHLWERYSPDGVDEEMWVNMCGCDRGSPTVLREAGRLELFGRKDGEEERIPVVRQRGEVQM